MNVHILQHVPFEGPGSIEDWATARGHTLTTTRFFAQEAFPSLDRFDLLVVMGGPMSIHDEHLYNWLKGEKWFVKEAIEAGKPVLGICLGAQLIAEVLGGKVYQGEQKEIGWYPIELDQDFSRTPLGKQWPTSPTVFHWHGETFTLPPNTQRIATSKVCANQGFIYQDRVVALQFHLETTPLSAESIIEFCGDELVAAPYIQDAETILSNHHHYSEINASMATLMDYLSQAPDRDG